MTHVIRINTVVSFELNSERPHQTGKRYVAVFILFYLFSKKKFDLQ